MRILLILFLLALIAWILIWLIPRLAPPEPDEKPTSDNPDQWEPYR